MCVLPVLFLLCPCLFPNLCDFCPRITNAQALQPAVLQSALVVFGRVSRQPYDVQELTCYLVLPLYAREKCSGVTIIHTLVVRVEARPLSGELPHRTPVHLNLLSWGAPWHHLVFASHVRMPSP